MKNPLDFQPIRAIFSLANRENSTIVHQKALQGIISEALFMPLFAKVLYQQAEPELGSKLRKPRDSNGGKRKKLNSPIFTPYRVILFNQRSIQKVVATFPSASYKKMQGQRSNKKL